MKKFILGILVLGLFLGYGCTKGKNQVPDFPEKIVDGFIVIEGASMLWECFANPVLESFHVDIGRFTVSYGDFHGAKTKRTIIAFFVITKDDNRIFLCAYYRDELLAILDKKYPGGIPSYEEATELLRPKINEAVEKIGIGLKDLEKKRRVKPGRYWE